MGCSITSLNRPYPDLHETSHSPKVNKTNKFGSEMPHHTCTCMFHLYTHIAQRKRLLLHLFMSVSAYCATFAACVETDAAFTRKRKETKGNGTKTRWPGVVFKPVTRERQIALKRLQENGKRAIRLEFKHMLAWRKGGK